MTTFTRPRVLRRLQISDVSSVDVGAGRGVRVVLTKRHTKEDDTMTTFAKMQQQVGATVAELIQKRAEARTEAEKRAIDQAISDLHRAEMAARTETLAKAAPSYHSPAQPARAQPIQLTQEKATDILQRAADGHRRANAALSKEQAFTLAYEQAPETLRMAAKGHVLVGG